MHEMSRDAYRIQGELQQEGNVAQFNSPGRGVGQIVIHVLSLMSTVIVSREARLISGRKRIDRRTSP
jgi:hypothetical protein